MKGECVDHIHVCCWTARTVSKGATTEGSGGGGEPPKIWTDHPQLFWWRVWLPFRNRLQSTKTGYTIRILFCTIT